MWDRFVLCVGERPETVEDEPFANVPLSALPLPNPRQFCFRYSLLELNTAVKPWMLAYLFDRGYDQVVYLDPDICVYSPLDELAAATAETMLVLTPHLTGSISGDDHPSERAILQCGAYNLGFLAVTRQAALPRFLAWWQDKLEHQCVVEIERGLFVDQKWMDLAPGLFPGVMILRHDGYNVAYWNLRQRALVDNGDGITVNGQPLRFFHFSGVDRAEPNMVSGHDGRLTVSDAPVAGRLIADYRTALVDAGEETFAQAPYPFAQFTDGTRIPDVARIAYRHSTALQTTCGDDPFAHPAPFQGMRDPARSPVAARIGVKSYRLLSRPRALVGLFPKSVRTALREFLLERTPQAPRAAAWKPALPSGLNIAGYLSRHTGVGESARLCRRACDAVGLANHVIDVDGTDALAQQPVYAASVYHVNADQIPSVHRQMPEPFAASARNIGFWNWEMPEFPDAWIASAEPLDEIWVASSFVQQAVSRKVPIPVVHMPYGIDVSEIAPCRPQEFGVPSGRFTFLCMFDLDSIVERKNPMAAVAAFRRAFPEPTTQALLIKVWGAGRHVEARTELAEALRGRPNEHLLDEPLTRARANGLLSGCDAVVSLHRSEGFGLVLAEAMSLGKPVVATGWSGNMDFMTDSNSCPVRYDLVTLDRSYGPYHAGQQWAEPDVDHAARCMRRLVEDAADREERGARARDTMRSQFSLKAAGRRYRQRLAMVP